MTFLNILMNKCILINLIEKGNALYKVTPVRFYTEFAEKV